MGNNTEFLAQLNNTMDEQIAVLSLIDDDEINTVPFEGSWTPGQVVQHVILSITMFAQLLEGPVADTERDPAQNVENLRAAFLNFDIKMQSPDFIIPPAIVYNKEELLHKLEELKARLNQSVPKLDLTKTCTAARLPMMGYLTALEVVTFILVHTQRHIHQLKNITQKNTTI